MFHLHVHVIPRKEGVAMKPPATEKEKPETLADHAQAARRRAEDHLSLQRPAQQRADDQHDLADDARPAKTERRIRK